MRVTVVVKWYSYHDELCWTTTVQEGNNLPAIFAKAKQVAQRLLPAGKDYWIDTYTVHEPFVNLDGCDKPGIL